MLDYTKTKYYERWVTKNPLFMLGLLIKVNAIHLLLQTIGLNRLLSVMELFLRKSKVIYAIPEEEKILEWRESTRHIFRNFRKNKYIFSNCLSTSVLFWFILRKQGLDTNLLIGTKKDKGEFKAHAWIELENYPLNAGKKVRQNYITFKYDFSTKLFHQ